MSYWFFLNLSNGDTGVGKNIQTKILTIKIKRKQKKKKKKIITIGQIPYALSQQEEYAITMDNPFSAKISFLFISDIV